jgi:hypothetical protein
MTSGPDREELERRLAAVPDLERRSSRWGPLPAYYIGEREIAHFHKDGRLDVRLTRTEIRERKARAALDPRVETRGPTSEWVAVRASAFADLAFVVDLVESALRANS